MTSLVMQTSFLGDVVLTTPLIAELARRGPVDVLTSPDGAAILQGNPDIQQIIDYDRRGRDCGIAGFSQTVGRIRRGHYDAAYMAQGSMRSALLVVLGGVRTRIGFNTSEGSRLYSDRVEYRADRHHAERLWWLAMPAGASPASRDVLAPRVFPSARDTAAADDLLRDGLSDSSLPFIALAPGSAWATKRWPYYPELAAKIAAEFNVVVVGGRAESEIGETIVAGIPAGRGMNAAGRMGILGSAAILGKAAALVSNDSAPQHLASAVGTPTVSVFGPTVPAFGFGPLGPASVVAGNDDLACRPCDRHGPHRCPLGHWRCMREVTSEAVFDILTLTLSYRASA
ncbi:MAG: glycosyltransferase family 9 protein [Gemmatimonadaceae bacterium]